MIHHNLWAPWRIEYLKSLDDSDRVQGDPSECFICRYRTAPQDDRKNLVLWRTPQSLTLLNRFPYTAGHILIAPAAHVATLEGLSHGGLLEMMILARDVQKALIEVIHPHGFNVGINIQRCAGAGLPGHVHLHVVPRWEGDTNFMSVCGDVRVISQGLDSLYDELARAGEKLNLPTLGD